MNIPYMIKTDMTVSYFLEDQDWENESLDVSYYFTWAITVGKTSHHT